VTKTYLIALSVGFCAIKESWTIIRNCRRVVRIWFQQTLWNRVTLSVTLIGRLLMADMGYANVIWWV